MTRYGFKGPQTLFRAASPGDRGDETWVKVGEKDVWIYVALDPRTLRIIYLEPLSRRDEYTTNLFLEYLVEEYGEWPKEVIIDGGRWYRAAFSFWQIEGKMRWAVVGGGARSVIKGFFGEFLKRRIKDFDKYSPTGSLESLRSWLSAFAWFHNSLIEGHF